MNNQPQPHRENWEEEFREKYKSHWHSQLGEFLPIPENQIKNMIDFISQQISQAQDAILEKAKEEIKEYIEAFGSSSNPFSQGYISGLNKSISKLDTLNSKEK